MAAEDSKTLSELIQRCKFCDREMDCSSLAYAENPFCSKCYEERVEKEKLIRERLDVADDEEIPLYALKYISFEPQPPLSDKDRAWAEDVAARYAAGEITY